MKKPKINVDRPKISEAELAANKNFGALIARFHAIPPASIPKPFYKTGWFFSVSAVVVTGVGILIYQLLKEPRPLVSEVSTRKAVAIESNSITAEIEDTLISVDSQAVSFNYDTLMAPVIEEAVVHTPVPIKQHMISQIVKSSKGSTIDAAKTDDTKQWLFAELEKIKAVIEEFKNNEPIKPAKKRGYRFKLDVVPEEFPKLAKHSGLLWEIGSEKQNESFTPDLLEKEWDEGKIKVYNRDINYKLILRKGELKHTFIIYPVLKDNEYDKYLKECAVHQKKLDSLSSIKSTLEKKYNKL